MDSSFECFEPEQVDERTWTWRGGGRREVQEHPGTSQRVEDLYKLYRVRVRSFGRFFGRGLTIFFFCFLALYDLKLSSLEG